MKPQSAKAKGRRLQQETRDAVLAAFPELEADDVRSTSMGASGADLLLSPYARCFFPYHVECKNVESLNVWKAFAQVEASHAKDHKATTPLLVVRRNSTRPLAILPFDAFLELHKRADGTS